MALPISHFIVATAGHVDHGKSALVTALTGTDPDRLPEEKARGITIDLGFAHLELRVPATQAGDQDRTLSLGLVDVPGHEDFVKNMVAGVGAVDLALLTVAADDGWMPQTEEHLQILTYLGVTRGIVVLTKIDLAGEREPTLVEAVRGQLTGSPFADAPIIPTSVVSGRGIPELKEALRHSLATVPAARDLGKPRLAVDRVFVLRGIGTLVTGSMTGGTFRRGQALAVQPSGAATRARSLQSYNRDIKQASPGARTAINLPDLGADPTGGGGVVKRGDVLTVPGLGQPCDTADVLLEKSGRLAGAPTPAARPLRDGTLVRIHAGSANFAARVLLHAEKELIAGRRGVAQLRFECPVFLFAGDRFIVRDWSEQATLAGGLVLDADASRKAWRTEAHLNLLTRRAAAPGDPVEWLASLLERDGAARRAGLLVKTRFAAADLEAAVRGLVARKAAMEIGAFVVDAAWWHKVRERAIAAVDAAHRDHPERPGLPLTELRTRLDDLSQWPGLFEGLVAELCQGGFQQSGTAMRRTGHRLALPPPLEVAGARLRTALSERPFDPPSRAVLAPDAAAQQAYRFLVNTGEVIELNPEVALGAVAYFEAIRRIQAHLRIRGQATVSELRQLIGSSRRVMVPLLEKLDREGFTRRQGDARSVGRTGPAVAPPAPSSGA